VTRLVKHPPQHRTHVGLVVDDQYPRHLLATLPVAN
jgi:hypothetical protein